MVVAMVVQIATAMVAAIATVMALAKAVAMTDVTQAHRVI
jgi:hypothetical protein